MSDFQPVPVHPLVDLAASSLVHTGEDTQSPLAFTPEGLSCLHKRLEACQLEGEPTLLAALTELAVFAVYLRDQQQGGAADALEALIVSLPAMQEELAQAGVERLQEVSAEFGRFSAPRAAVEEPIATTMSPVSAKDLLRRYIK